jgi:hypothetical protein
MPSKASLLARRAEKTAVAGFKFAASILYGFLPMVTLFAQAIAVLSALAVALVLLRIAIIKLAPSFALHAKTWAAAANVFMEVFALIMFQIRTAILAIQDIVLALQGKHPKPFSTLVMPRKVDATKVAAFANTLSTTCVEYNSAGAILGFLFKQALHSTVCPLLRAAAPVRWANVVLPALIGWASYDYRPHPVGDNCQHPEPALPAMTCVGLGTGILLAEIVIPLLLACILLFNSGAALAVVGSGILHVAAYLIYAVLWLAERVPAFFRFGAHDVKDFAPAASDNLQGAPPPYPATVKSTEAHLLMF